MKKYFMLIWMLLLLLFCKAQPVIIIDSLPPNTPPGAEIFIAGDFQGWNPADTNYMLIYDSINKIHHIDLNLSPGTISYKFTRGSWSTVEGNELGGFRPDRTLTFNAGDTAYHTVLSWEDLGGSGCISTAGPTVMIYDTAFFIPQLNTSRRIWVYLPADYASASYSYPVLYVHDGQNIFDQCTSFVGEWEIDESMDQIAMDFDTNIIVVGIDNGGASRLDEYSPWVNPTYGGGDGEKYMDFIVQTLKPQIDNDFRTKSSRENTGIMGSSMGGLISFYGAVNHPDIFSKAGIFSPSFWFSPDSLHQFIKDHPKTENIKFYFLMGGQEGSQAVSNMVEVADSLVQVGYSDNDMIIDIPSDGQHSEWFWRREYPDAFKWLYLDIISSISELENNDLMLYPNPAKDLLHLKPEKIWSQIQVFSIDGRKVMMRENVKKLNISNLLPGMYFLLAIDDGHSAFAGKFMKTN